MVFVTVSLQHLEYTDVSVYKRQFICGVVTVYEFSYFIIMSVNVLTVST